MGKPKSSSGNLAYPWISSTFEPGAESAWSGGTNMLGNILGLNGSGAGSQALNDYYNSTGGQFLLNKGVSDTTSKYGQLGLLRSGSFGKALEGYRQDLMSTKLDNYLGQLQGLAKLGLAGGSLVADAGQYSKSKGAGPLGSIAAGVGSLLSTIGPAVAASDRRLKTNIEKIGELADGLGVYEFDYLPVMDLPGGRQRGVMADEVARLRPWALGPELPGGFASVDYGAL